MIEEEIENLSEFTGEEFYQNIEKEYGRNVEKLLRYHDIDSCYILARAEENEIIGVFEEPNNEHSSNELMALKKDLCNFTDEKVSLKVGTKAKMITLLRTTRDYYRKRKAQILSGKKSNGFNQLQSLSPLTNDNDNFETNSTDLPTSVNRSIMTLLITLKNTIHGAVVENASADDFKISIQYATDDSFPTCYVQCICGYRIRLFHRGSGFQTSNLLKHLKVNKLNFTVSNKDQQSVDKSEFSNEMNSHDEDSDKENAASSVSSIRDRNSSIDNERIALSMTRKNKETSYQRHKSRTASSNNDNFDSSSEETNDLHLERRSSRISLKTGGIRSSISFDNQSSSKKQSKIDDASQKPSSTISIRSIKRSYKQNEESNDFPNGRKRKSIDDYQQMGTISSTKSAKAQNQQPVDNKTDGTDFLSAVLETIDLNSHRPSNNYVYSPCILRFSTALSILCGRYAYEYLRTNLRFLLPTIQTIQNNWSYSPYSEAEFRFNECQARLDALQCKYIFVSEDCSAIIPRIEYDPSTNAFNGFITPIVEGVPSRNSYQCTSFEELQDTFERVPASKLVNIHVVQPIPGPNVLPPPSASVLSAYGTDNKITAIDILKRWLMIYKEFYQRGTRVLGYSTDGDPKYLRGMRLAANFFVNNETLNILNGTLAFTAHIPSNWSCWYFLNSTQMFTFMQDGVHLATKIRNRLLSTTADLIMGSYEISIEHLYELIQSTNKIDHNLSVSDLNVKDKQNFTSCQKISSDDVLDLLSKNDEYNGTYTYLLILNLLIIVYTDRSISINDRIFYGWVVVFYIRLWRIWLYVKRPKRKPKLSTKKKKTKRKQENSPHFITSNALMCIELNAHFLIYIYLLIEQNILPSSVAENIFLFSSQPCENVFRNARALSGVYCTRINFTINQFLKRVNKLNVLTELKEFEANNDKHQIVFPMHYKIRKFISQTKSTIGNTSNCFSVDALEEIIQHAYEVAQQMAIFVNMSTDLIQNNLFDFEQSSRLSKRLLQLNCLTESEILDVDASDDESSDDEEEEDLSNIVYVHDLFDDDNGNDTPTTSFENVQSTTYSGLRLYQSVPISSRKSYFQVNVRVKKLFFHKQTASWYLQDKQQKLSCDRLKRVQVGTDPW